QDQNARIRRIETASAFNCAQVMFWLPASPCSYSSGGSLSLTAATTYRPPLITTTPISNVAIVVREVTASPTSNWVATMVANAEKMFAIQVLITSTLIRSSRLGAAR